MALSFERFVIKMQSNIHQNFLAIVGLAICTFVGATSWMSVRFSSMVAQWDLGDYSSSIFWLLGAYVIQEISVMPLAGKLVDSYGERKVLTVGFLLFILGCFLCTIPSNIFEFSITRAVQGFGTGFVFAAAFTASGRLFPKRELSIGQEFMTIGFALGSLFSATIGYWFLDNLSEASGWKTVYLLFGLIMLLGYIISMLYLPKSKPNIRPLDLQGMVISFGILFLGCFVIECYNVRFFNDNHWTFFAPLAVFSLIVALYYRHKLALDPVMPTSLNKSRKLLILVLAAISFATLSMLQYFFKLHLLLYSDFSLETGFDLGKMIYGSSYLFIVFLQGAAAPAMIGSKTVHKKGMRFYLLIGTLVLSMQMVLTYLLVDKGEIYMYICICMMGVGLGCIITEILVILQIHTPVRDMGSVSSTAIALRMTGIIAGLSICQTLIYWRIDSFLEPYSSGTVDYTEVLEILLEVLFIYLEDGINLLPQVMDLYVDTVKAWTLLSLGVAICCFAYAYFFMNDDDILDQEFDDEAQYDEDSATIYKVD